MIRRLWGGRSLHGQAGQAIVEFTLIAPILFLLLLAIGDFSRVYTTALTVEAGVREGADFGSFQSYYWKTTGSSPTNEEKTKVEIKHRVCQATSTLPEYASADSTNMTCTNPDVTIELSNPSGLSPDCSVSPVPSDKFPCMVHVSAEYSFRLFFGGVGIGSFTFPSTITISREAYFVVNDFPTP